MMDPFRKKLLGESRSSWEEIPQDWRFTKKQQEALLALHGYGLEMRADDSDEETMTFVIPMDLPAEVYLEIGYLIAQVARDDFPSHYSRFGFATDAWTGVDDPTVRFLDMCPGGYRVKIEVEVETD